MTVRLRDSFSSTRSFTTGLISAARRDSSVRESGHPVSLRSTTSSSRQRTAPARTVVVAVHIKDLYDRRWQVDRAGRLVHNDVAVLARVPYVCGARCERRGRGGPRTVERGQSLRPHTPPFVARATGKVSIRAAVDVASVGAGWEISCWPMIMSPGGATPASARNVVVSMHVVHRDTLCYHAPPRTVRQQRTQRDALKVEVDDRHDLGLARYPRDAREQEYRRLERPK